MIRSVISEAQCVLTVRRTVILTSEIKVKAVLLVASTILRHHRSQRRADDLRGGSGARERRQCRQRRRRTEAVLGAAVGLQAVLVGGRLGSRRRGGWRLLAHDRVTGSPQLAEDAIRRIASAGGCARRGRYCQTVGLVAGTEVCRGSSLCSAAHRLFAYARRSRPRDCGSVAPTQHMAVAGQRGHHCRVSNADCTRRHCWQMIRRGHCGHAR